MLKNGMRIIKLNLKNSKLKIKINRRDNKYIGEFEVSKTTKVRIIKGLSDYLTLLCHCHHLFCLVFGPCLFH